MSKNWGRTPVVNADKRHLTQMTYMAPAESGGFEERVDRRPMGKVERFVDKDGGVMSLQIYTDGDPKRLESEQRNRSAYHKKGMVEYAKCPIKHGTRNASEIARKDFSKMPDDLAGECQYDPRPMHLVGGDKRLGVKGDLHAGESCPHIEWLIKFRKEQAASAYAKRNAHVAAIEKAKQDEEDLKKLQLAKLRAEVQTPESAPGRKLKKDPTE